MKKVIGNDSAYIKGGRSEHGFTLVSASFRLLLITAFLPLCMLLISKITTVPAQEILSVYQLFFILQNELYQAEEFAFSPTQLFYVKEEEKVQLEQYETILRRRVKGQGHEVYQQDIDTFLVQEHPQGIKVRLTLLSGESYERVLYVP